MPKDEKITYIQLSKLKALKINRRIGGFNEAKLKNLAESIQSTGVLNPLIVRPSADKAAPEGELQVICGERRLRAAEIAGIDTVPVLIREAPDVEVLKIHAIENLQRDDLHPLDEADYLHRLIEMADYSVGDLAVDIGKSETYIYQRIQLLHLTDALRELYLAGAFSSSGAMLLCRLTKEIQGKLLKNLKGHVATDQIRQMIQLNVNQDISHVGFDPKNKDLVKKAGACTDCPKFADNSPYLFEDLRRKGEAMLCMDPTCLKKKIEAEFARQVKGFEKSKTDFFYLREDWTNQGFEKGLDPTTIKQPYTWQETDKGEDFGIILDGIRRGTVVLFGSSSTTESSMTPEEKKEAEKKRKELAKLRFEMVVRREAMAELIKPVSDRIKAYVQEENDGLPNDILRVVCLEFAREMDSDDLAAELGVDIGEREWPEIDDAVHKAIEKLDPELLPWLLARSALMVLNPHDDEGEAHFRRIYNCIEGFDYDDAKKDISDRMKLEAGKKK